MVQLGVIVVLFAAGYQRATWFRGRYGRTQWDWPPFVWGLVCAFAFLVGIVLLAVAERQGRARAAQLATPAGRLPASQPNYWASPATPPARAPLAAETPQQQWIPTID